MTSTPALAQDAVGGKPTEPDLARTRASNMGCVALRRHRPEEGSSLGSGHGLEPGGGSATEGSVRPRHCAVGCSPGDSSGLRPVAILIDDPVEGLPQPHPLTARSWIFEPARTTPPRGQAPFAPDETDGPPLMEPGARPPAFSPARCSAQCGTSPGAGMVQCPKATRFTRSLWQGRQPEPVNGPRQPSGERIWSANSSSPSGQHRANRETQPFPAAQKGAPIGWTRPGLTAMGPSRAA